MSYEILLRLRLMAGLGAIWLALAAAWNVPVILSAALTSHAGDGTDPCPPRARLASYNVSLINIPLFLNRFGDVVADGRMYILDEHIETARRTFARAADPNDPKDIIEPLVLRVNRGECLEVTFTNRLNEPAPPFERDESIFTLPGENLLPPGSPSPHPREFAPAITQPGNRFDPANAPAASMHFTGLTYDVTTADGTAAGNNPNSTAVAGQSVTYRLFADLEGQFPFQDGADLTSHATGAGNFIGSNVFGAFGAVIVEPRGTAWFDVNTGQPLKSGARAIIRDRKGPDFREHVLFMHDEIEAAPGILTRFCIPAESPPPPIGSDCINPTAAQLAKLQAGTIPALGGGDADALVRGEIPVKLEWMGFNYRSEPGFNRDEVGCPARPATPDISLPTPACVGEETSLSSWPFGDPGGGDLVFHNYRGEPMKIHLIHGAEFETHSFHWHVHRWPFDPKNEGGLERISRGDAHTRITNPIDVQAVSPGAHYELVPEGGAGSAHDQKPATVGDVIFHCHLYPHFANGMWGLNRVHDVLEDGTRQLPDTTPVLPLVPLDDFPAPPAPTAEKPGFPFFMPGQFGFKGPKPPLGVPERQSSGVFPPTTLEIDAAESDARIPGAFFVNPCPDKQDDDRPTPLKVFDVAAIQLNKVYSPVLGWQNPQHRVFVLQEHKADVLNGVREPEPFSPLLNIGDCVEYRLTNELPVQFGGTVFDRLQTTNEVSIHQHLVQFDVLTSDGAANGWNYDQGADPGQTIVYRDFVSGDIKTNSFHDHFFPAMHQKNGLFGGSTIHPAGCTFHDPVTGHAVKVGTIVDIRCPKTTDYHRGKTDGADYRSFALFIEDHVPMFQPQDPGSPFNTPFGVPIFPAKFPSSPDDQGVMGVNYRLEPFEARRDADPANLFSSRVHGDPFTPLLRAYAGDRIRINMFQLSFEESHGFNLHRWRWEFEPNDRDSNIVQAQHISMLESFALDIPIAKETDGPGDLDLRDYLYFYGGADDWFLGAWGILRVTGCVDDAGALSFLPLQPLPDNPVRTCKNPVITAERTPGNPCPTDRYGHIRAPIRRFHVAAINKDIVYNHAGDHDPNGLMYVQKEALDAVRSGAKQPEPLVLRANVGDCIEVTLENLLDPAKTQPHCFEALEPGQLGFKPPQPGSTFPDCVDDQPDAENEVPGFLPFPVSSRVSMNPKLVDYHIGSDGANVGFNPDSTVGPGEKILYRWFAAEETGLGVFQDRGDVQNHLHHGLFGALITEPGGSWYADTKHGWEVTSGQEAIIVPWREPPFREFVVFMNSDLALFQANGLPVPFNEDLSLEPSHEADDPEDMGHFSIGYRNEPWVHRFLNNPDLSLVFSSLVHGDPATPIFRAYAGDNVRFRVAQAIGDPRSTIFALHGHRWRRSPDDRGSQIAVTQGQFNPTTTFNIHLEPWVFGGAGGPLELAGDYLYRSNNLFRHLNGGQWGIFRVFDEPQPDLFDLRGRRTGLSRLFARPSVQAYEREDSQEEGADSPDLGSSAGPISER